ncbi:MAG: PKD domain-containing protein [Thiogranum sp.]
MFTRLFLTLALTLSGWEGVTAAPFDPNWGTVGVFTDAQTCAGCHRASAVGDTPAVMRFPDMQGEDISPSYQWRHSMMAHAFDDPFYQAVVEDEATLFTALAGLVEDTCLTCHTPMAHTHAHQTGTDLSQDTSCTLPDGCYRLATASVQDHAREGVSCTLCHQIKDDNLGSAASFSGGFSIAEAGDVDAFTIYGPYQNPHTGGAALMQSSSGYTPLFGSQVTSSAHCASCHTLFTPTLDVATDQPTGAEFLEQGAFLEWQNSVYASGASEEQQCQDCHMPDPAPAAYSTRIAVRPTGTVNTLWPERAPFFTHSMVGGNSHVLELLRDNRIALGIENSTSVSGFDEKIGQTRDLLQNQTAALDITQTAATGGELTIDVRISNHAGHKLPTGYPSRRIWIHLTARDASDQVIFESGAADAQGRISTDSARLAPACLAIRKTAGFDSADCFEPHRDVIDDPAQVALYEPVLGDSNGDITHILLHAAGYLKDNRIPPEGFTNSRADSIEPQTRPVGVDADPDFNITGGQEGSGSDTVHYRIALNTPNGPYRVDARLLYQAVSPSFVDGLHSSGGRVSDFKQMYAQNPSVIETLASSTASSDANTAPVADAGADQTVAVNANVQLDGSASSDADNDPLSYAWSFTSRPTDSQAVLSDPTAVTPTFSADRAGSYQVQLIVNDGRVDSAADTVSITSNADETSNSGGGGGGCAMTTATATADPVLPALVLLALTGLSVRRRARVEVRPEASR